MGRDSWRFRQSDEEREKRKRMNPVWRGVGCFTVVLLTLTGYLFAGWFLMANLTNHWIYMPPEVLRPSFAPWLPAGVLVQIVVAFIFMVMSYGALSLFYAIAFPIRPGETDVPPLKRPRRRRRR